MIVGHFHFASVIKLTPSFRLLPAYEDCVLRNHYDKWPPSSQHPCSAGNIVELNSRTRGVRACVSFQDNISSSTQDVPRRWIAIWRARNYLETTDLLPQIYGFEYGDHHVEALTICIDVRITQDYPRDDMSPSDKRSKWMKLKFDEFCFKTMDFHLASNTKRCLLWFDYMYRRLASKVRSKLRNCFEMTYLLPMRSMKACLLGFEYMDRGPESEAWGGNPMFAVVFGRCKEILRREDHAPGIKNRENFETATPRSKLHAERGDNHFWTFFGTHKTLALKSENLEL
ncbi:hypothetical protein ARMGADRAFT_1034308 [Armillaria gallica]|uniref:Uncharacterized protein n=1 Tax=Armillaria gallica TaxID=47427 RepID=A0A2H3CYB5_ARMGA|nr:hypothetical protein ARMGADRAFT_1034308 [Armillaria gallica]